MTKVHIIKAAMAMLGLCAAMLPSAAAARDSLMLSAEAIVNASTGKFAPYMIGSWNGGRVIYGCGTQLDLRADKPFDMSRRFSWEAGVEGIFGWTSGVDYSRYDNTTSGWTTHSERQRAARLQQLYASVKYRSVFLSAGMKETHSVIVDDRYSSGDLTRGNSSRPVPGITVGFIDFRDIPLINGWVQIQGEITYGKFFDTGFTERHYNKYNNIMAGDLYYTYKRCYFRTKPSQPLSVTVGMQTAGQFGGWTEWYSKGQMTRRDHRGFKAADIWHMFFPEHNNGEGNAIGNSLGSWDLNVRYRFRDGKRLSFYTEWPWEDGSGIGRRNGWDGLWGLQFDMGRKGPFETVVVEYLDFTNQAGPLHYEPGDRPGADLTTAMGGSDNYYNNVMYGPYANYGMSMGTPFLMSPIYNTDGFWWFAHNRARGAHLSVGGHAMPAMSYRVMAGYQKAWGWGYVPQAKARECWSLMADMKWQVAPRRIPGLEVGARLAFDAGKLRGDNFGGLVSVKYSGSILFGK